MVTAGVSPRMMAQKAQVAGISREPTAVPGPVPNIPNDPAPSPRRRHFAPAKSVLRLLAQRGVLAGGGDPESLLRDADALDFHPGRQLRDAEGEVRQVAEDVGRYPGEVGDLDVDLVVADLGALG